MARRRETARHALSRASPFPVILLKKARWGKDGGPGGKETTLCASRDRRRPQAVPVATKEATGIDSRDKGVSFPPEKRFSVDT